MPIEIKELHIRVAVNSSPNGPPPAKQTASGGDSNGLPSDDAKELLVAECVEQVLQILQRKVER
jgi:hypothetical protein